MLAQCARLLAFYASLVYNLWKHKITTKKPNMSKNSTMNIFINSGEKILPAQKLSIFTKEKPCFFIGPKGFHNENNKVKRKHKKVDLDPLFSLYEYLTNS